MHGVVKVKGLNTLYALKELPDERDELELVEEGAWISAAPNLGERTEGADEPSPVTLAVCKTDPKQYRMFRYAEEAEAADFEPTGLTYGGVYTPEMWRRLTKAIPRMRAFEAIPDGPPGAWERAMEYLQEGR